MTGALTSGGSTNDTDLTVRVSLSGTNAVAGDTLQLYNGTGTSSQLGTSYTITSGDISNGFADVQTGALSNGATYTITARVTDQAGNQSTASGSFIVTEAGTAPAAPAITSVTDDVLPVTGTVADNGFSNDATLTITGTAEAGSTVTLYDTDGTTVLGTGVASGGASRSRRRRWARAAIRSPPRQRIRPAIRARPRPRTTSPSTPRRRLRRRSHR